MGNFISKLKNWAIRAGLQFPKDRRWNFFSRWHIELKLGKKCNKDCSGGCRINTSKIKNKIFWKNFFCFQLDQIYPSSGSGLLCSNFSHFKSLRQMFQNCNFCCFIALCGWEATTRWCVPLNYWNQFFYNTPCEERREEEEGSVRRCLCFSIIINV